MAQALLSRGGPGGGFGEASGDSPLYINGGYLAIDALGDGTDMVTFTPTKDYATVVLSSPDLEAGATYTVYTGGSSTGTEVDGRYTGGVYTLGTEVGTFTL